MTGAIIPKNNHTIRDCELENRLILRNKNDVIIQRHYTQFIPNSNTNGLRPGVAQKTIGGYQDIELDYL
jgi:hypothetical protein